MGGGGQRSSDRLVAAALATIALVTAGAFAGCGSGAPHTVGKGDLALERTQLVQVSAGLRSLEAPIRAEVGASRDAWPQIASGLPQVVSPALRTAVGRASASARAVPQPSFMAITARLTGPAAGISGIYENYSRLSERGWRLIEASIATIASGSLASVGFARQNSSLYIDAIYDAHFDLSLVGKSLLAAYAKLGGAPAFGAALTPHTIGALAAAYSIPAVRLSPHPVGAATAG